MYNNHQRQNILYRGDFKIEEKTRCLSLKRLLATMATAACNYDKKR